MKLEILKRNKRKKLIGMIRENFGFDGDLNYDFLKSGKNRIWIVSKDVSLLDLRELDIARLGVYFCRTDFKELLKFSIEGSQIIGPECKKRVLEIGEDKANRWIKGRDLKLGREPGIREGFILIRHQEDFLGCGKLVGKKVWNYVPKERRII